MGKYQRFYFCKGILINKFLSLLKLIQNSKFKISNLKKQKREKRKEKKSACSLWFIGNYTEVIRQVIILPLGPGENGSNKLEPGDKVNKSQKS